MAYNVNPNSSDKIYRWIERKPLTEAVAWTIREQFYLIAAVSVYGSDWKSIAQIVKNAGEPYRPKEWYTQKNCERQLRIIVISQSREVQSMSVTEMLNYIYQNLLTDYERDLKRTTDINIAKCISLQGVMNRMKQGNLSRNEINSLHSQAKRHEIEGKQYMEQLRTRQNATLASENLTSGLSEEPIKWNAPSAPLLTSLLRSRSTISTNRNTTPTSSQLQLPGSTSRTRSGKLLPLTTSSVRTTQGTPTLSKLLEAPANPYIPSPSQPAQKSKQNEIIGADKLVGNTSKKENSQSPTLNKVRVDGLTPGPFNQLNKPDLTYTKRQMSRSPVSTIKNGSKASSSVVNLLSDSENEDDNKNSTQDICPKNIIAEKKDTSGNINRVEPRATRSQTRAEGGFKQLNDNKLSDGKKDRETPRHQSGSSQITETQSIDDLIDIDQIEVEPLSTVQDEILTSKVTRSSIQRLGVQNPTDNLLVNKSNNKEINNQMLEEISANFILNSTVKNVASDYKNVMVGQSRIDNGNVSGCLVPMDGSAIKDSILLRKDSQCFSNSGNTLPTLDGKLLKQKRIIELKGANLKCIDSRNEKTILSFTNQPIVVVNKIKKPFNFKLTTEANDKGDNVQVTNYETKKAFRLQGSTQNLVQLLDSHSLSDEVIIIDDDVNINVDDKSTESSSKSDMQNKSIKAVTCNENSNVLCNSTSTNLQVDDKKTKNDKTLWNMFGKPQNLIDNLQKKVANQDGLTKSGTSSNIQDTNNRFIKELDFDFDQSNSLSELYNGVEEIVEMHSFDNEELNSLIECGSLDNSGTQERQNTVTLDKADCSVSECDSTIGAFDTFAQITRMPQKTISSKDNTIVSKEIKTIKDGKDLERSGSFVRVEDIEDDQATASVTGIPVLQGVISDVMSKIDSDRVAALSKTIEPQQVPINDIVEISSDEEGTEKSESETSLKVTELNTTQEYNKNINVKKLTEDKLLTFENPEITLIKDGNFEFETNTKSTDKSENISKEIASSTSKPEYINITTNSLNAIRKCVSNKVIEIGSNSQSKNEMELYEDSKKEMESKCVQRSEFIKNKKDEVECKKEVEINIQINEDKLKHDAIKNNKEKNEKLLIERDEIIKTGENEKKIKTVEGKEDNTKELEVQIIQKSKQNEEKYVKTAEIIKLKEPEIRKINNFELNKRTNTIINENKQSINVTEFGNTKISEIETQIDNGVEIQNRETEILKAIEVEEKEKLKDVERQHVDKAMIQKVREAEILKAKIVADIQRTKEVEARRLKDIEMKKEEEAEVQRANEIKEVEILKTKEIDNKHRKTKTVLESEILAKVKGAEYLVVQNIEDKETGIKNNAGETKCASEDINEKLQKEKETLISEDLPKKSKKEEKSVLESRSIINESGTKEFESEIIMSKEQELKNVTENEVKTNKDVQIITRTRGSLKIEEKLKESNIISKNLFGRTSESPSFTISITSSSDFQTSNYEYKNQAKNLFDENKRNNSCINSSAMFDNNKDLGVDSGECISEVGGKSRTRSSLSFKQSKVMETKSSPCNRSSEGCEPCVIPKTTLGTEKITSVDLKMLTNSDLKHSTDLSKIESTSTVLTDNRGKKLTVSVVMLNANDVPIPKEKGDQCTDIYIKQSEIKSTDNELILSTGIDFNEKSDKPVPKKRGRKRRIDTSNLQQSNSDKLTHQNIAATAGLNTSLNKIDPPAKRTRKSIVLHDNNISIEERNKKNLSYIYDNIYENNKLLSSFKKLIKDITSESCPVIKHPVELMEIKKKINSGEITKMSQLQINLLLISYNACMLNKSNSTIFAEITNFQSELLKNCQLSQCTIDKDNELYQTKKNININQMVDDDGSDIYEEFDSSDVDSDNMGYETEDKDIVNENYFTTAVALLKSIDNSSNYDSSDTECDGEIFKNKKNESFSDKSSDYEDSDSYSSNFD